MSNNFTTDIDNRLWTMVKSQKWTYYTHHMNKLHLTVKKLLDESTTFFLVSTCFQSKKKNTNQKENDTLFKDELLLLPTVNPIYQLRYVYIQFLDPSLHGIFEKPYLGSHSSNEMELLVHVN